MGGEQEGVNPELEKGKKNFGGLGRSGLTACFRSAGCFS
jgi:hypothetical protein